MRFQHIKYSKITCWPSLVSSNDWCVLALKVTLASLIAALLAMTIVPAQTMFLILGTLFFMITVPEASKKEQLNGMFLTSLLSSAGVLLATLTNQHLFLLLLVTAFYAVIAMWLTRVNAAYGMAGVLALLFVIITGGVAGNSAMVYPRLLNCLLAFVIGFSIQFILFPAQPVSKLKRLLTVLLSDIADYFYHTSMDCLRGNHINPRHWQIKERILLKLGQSRILLASIPVQTDKIVKLKTCFTAEERLLNYLFPLVSIITNPANNGAFINLLPPLAQFSYATHALMGDYVNYLRQSRTTIEETAFVQAFTDLQQAVNAMIDDTLQKSIIYQWPFDITIFVYLLTIFSRELLNFKQILSFVTE